MAHLGLEREPCLPEFFGRDVLRSIGRPEDNGCDAAAIFEQSALVLGLKTHVAEIGEMQHRPKTDCWVREIMARNRGAQSRIDTAEGHIENYGQECLDRN